MQFFANINIPELEPPIGFDDKIMLTGSCFTEHIGNHLKKSKFNIVQNPNGILFEPLSVCSSLIRYIENRHYQEKDLFYLNEAWHSWFHHSCFSGLDKTVVIENINNALLNAHTFLKEANWLIITLGSSFSYRLTKTNMAVANCHKMPAKNFTKHLCTINEIVEAFDTALYRLFIFNPGLQVLFTISPVRHLRDGVVENNRSKARLIEAVHHLISKFDQLHYFPSYELVVDVLRDYRFYDADLAHPNYAATSFVLENFYENCMDKKTRDLAEIFRKIAVARNHRPFNPSSQQHAQFLSAYYQQTLNYSKQFPQLDFEEELAYFKQAL